jgi:hypothetical protein
MGKIFCTRASTSSQTGKFVAGRLGLLAGEGGVGGDNGRFPNKGNGRFSFLPVKSTLPKTEYTQPGNAHTADLLRCAIGDSANII